VPVTELGNLHLVAEYRELPRVFPLVINAIARGETPESKISEYVLGTGHVRFFYNKLGYLAKRQDQLVTEMLGRGFKPSFTNGLWAYQKSIPSAWWNDWVPTEKSLVLNRNRIAERLSV